MRVGTVASLFRYPVKSMGGEALPRAYLNEHGMEGDRLYAFESSGAPAGMLRLTGRERRGMLEYRALLAEVGGVEVEAGDGSRCGWIPLRCWIGCKPVPMRIVD
jgi:uncharacterized protein YcbX